jgi:hypothetical protein
MCACKHGETSDSAGSMNPQKLVLYLTNRRKKSFIFEGNKSTQKNKCKSDLVISFFFKFN